MSKAPTTTSPKAPTTSPNTASPANAADPKAVARKAKHEKFKAAGLVIRAAIKDGSAAKALSAAGMDNLMDALKIRFPGPGGGGGFARTSGEGPYDKAVGLFKGQAVGFTVDELTLFKATRIGRGEMRSAIRHVLKKAAPADRLWIEFNGEKEVWELKGIGEKAPNGWSGYDLNSKVSKAS